MTNSEAIESLKNESCYECSYGCKSVITCQTVECKYKDAMQMAIKSLECDNNALERVKMQEPCGMTAEEYRNIALDLLNKYIDAEETVCSEFSGDFYKDRLRLERVVKEYLINLDAEDKYEEIINDRWIFEVDGGDSDDE